MSNFKSFYPPSSFVVKSFGCVDAECAVYTEILDSSHLTRLGLEGLGT